MLSKGCKYSATCFAESQWRGRHGKVVRSVARHPTRGSSPRHAVTVGSNCPALTSKAASSPVKQGLAEQTRTQPLQCHLILSGGSREARSEEGSITCCIPDNGGLLGISFVVGKYSTGRAASRVSHRGRRLGLRLIWPRRCRWQQRRRFNAFACWPSRCCSARIVSCRTMGLLLLTFSACSVQGAGWWGLGGRWAGPFWHRILLAGGPPGCQIP